MNDDFILIKDQENGKGVATTLSKRRDWNNNPIHLQLQAPAARSLEMNNNGRYVNHKDTSRKLLAETSYPYWQTVDLLEIPVSAFSVMAWMSGDNTVSGDDELYIVGGADNTSHMVNLADPLNPQVTNEYFAALPVEMGNEMAAACQYQASIYVLGMNGRMCSHPTDDELAGWTLYPIEWGEFENQCTLVKSRSSSSQNRWFVLERGAYKEILYTSSLSYSTPDEGREYPPSFYNYSTGAVIFWSRWNYRLMLFDIVDRQAYTYETDYSSEFPGWKPYGDQFNYDCTAWANLQELGNLLCIFTAKYGGVSYATLDMDVKDHVWSTNQPNGYLQGMMFTVFAGSTDGGNQMGDADYIFFFGGWENEGIDASPLLRLLIKSVPPITFDLLDCRDATKVKSCLVARNDTDATSVTLTPVLFNDLEQPIFTLPSFTVTKPATPFIGLYDEQIWGCNEFDVSGASYFGIFIEEVLPGDEKNGNLYLMYSAI